MSFYKEYEDQSFGPKYYPKKKPLGNSGLPKCDANDENFYEDFLKKLDKHRTMHKGQKEIHDLLFKKNIRYLFLRIGRKGAKTSSNIESAWKYCLKNIGSVCYIGAPTIAQATEIYWDERRLQRCDVDNDELLDQYVESIDKANKMITFVNGSFIKLIGTWSESRGRGTQPDLLIMDEVQDCSAEYMDAMEPNLAAKPDSRLILTGTPPRKRNHYHEWETKIIDHPFGKRLHYSSYINTALPHLKDWLDRQEQILTKMGKRDQWLREYMAEDCFSSDDRLLPDVTLVDYLEMLMKLRAMDYTSFIPILGLRIAENAITAVFCVMHWTRYTGAQIWVLEIQHITKLFDKSYMQIESALRMQQADYSARFTKPWRKIVYDETESFTDIIRDFSPCRKDVKWEKRGLPLLKEMLVSKKLTCSNQCDKFGMEAQNILKEDALKDYPTVCTLAMIVNEYYSPAALSKEEQMQWDRFQPLRESGICCTLPKKKGLKIYDPRRT